MPALGGGGTATWTADGYDQIQSTISPQGVASPPQPVEEPAAFMTDAGGDVALDDLEFAPIPSDIVIRPAHGGPDEAAPGEGGGVFVAAPTGRVFAFLSVRNGEPRWRYAIWRP